MLVLSKDRRGVAIDVGKELLGGWRSMSGSLRVLLNVGSMVHAGGQAADRR